MSGLRCKPGDLAIVVADNAKGWAGAIVDVIELVTQDHYRKEQFGPMWVIRTNRDLLVCDLSVVRANTKKTRIAPAGTLVWMPDCDLQPIRPPAVDQSTKQEQEITA